MYELRAQIDNPLSRDMRQGYTASLNNNV